VGGGVGAGTFRARAGLRGDAGRWARWVVVVLVVVDLGFELLARSGAFGYWRLCVVGVALAVLSIVPGL
jgi:hypothetical protein